MKTFLKYTIQSAGDLAMEWFQREGILSSQQKSSVKDIVTEADVAVEQFIRDQLHRNFPDFGFLGEESGIQSGTDGRWIVDPIDGTLSFARGHDYWSVSIAVEIAGQIQMGAVYAPARRALFFAEKGQGATCNDKPIQVTSVDALNQSVLATGFACLRANLEDNNLPRFNRLAAEVLGLRIRGSAALDLCSVAEGQLDGFWEQTLNLYDVAAGALIASEAGAQITDFQGKPELNPDQVLVSNGFLHPALLEMM